MQLWLPLIMNHKLLLTLAIAFFSVCKVSSLGSETPQPQRSEHIATTGKQLSEVTSSGKHLLRRVGPPEANHEGRLSLTLDAEARVVENGCKDDGTDCMQQRERDKRLQGTGAMKKLSAIASHEFFESGTRSLALIEEKSSHWQLVSATDVQAIAVDGDSIYAVATDPLAILEKGIFKQPLDAITPYSNWTLLGYGSMTSIAIHNSVTGKVMYGVGDKNWLFSQDIAVMPTSNVWTVTSTFPLTAIAISGDTIYGTSPHHPETLFKQSLLLNISILNPWEPAGTGRPAESLSVINGLVFAYSEGTMYSRELSAKNGFGASELTAYEKTDWSGKSERGMQSIAVFGDTIYGVSADHMVYRKPLIVNEKWAKVAQVSMQSLAIHTTKGIIYGTGDDGTVYKQDLTRLNGSTAWVPASALSNVVEIAIQGDTIYGVGTDHKVYKQSLHIMGLSTTWEEAAACCVTQIAAADGIVFGVGLDHSIYHQMGVLMEPNNQWILANTASVLSIAIRGDTIYGLDTGGNIYEQPLSTMKVDSKWTPSSMEDGQYPSAKYLSIMVHNDIMYACGEDMAVYTKLIAKAITYPSGLSVHGNTHKQALEWNLTDLPVMPWTPPHMTPVWQASTTTQQVDREQARAQPTVQANAGHQQAPVQSTKQFDDAVQVIDCFGDQRGPGCNNAAVEGIENGVRHAAGAWLFFLAAILVLSSSLIF